MIPLFPEDDQFISIKQGDGGDCYLLASLDCILNGDSKNRKKIQSLFTQTSTGGELRIKSNPQSSKLQIKN